MLFITFFYRVQWAIAPLAIIPVAAGSWYFGTRGGLLIAILSVPTNMMLPTIFGHASQEFIRRPTGVIGSLALVLLSVIIGRISTMMAERKDAFIKLEKRVKQLSVLHEVALISTKVESIDTLIERTTEIIGKSLFPDNFGMLLMDEEKSVLLPHRSYRFGIASDRSTTEISLGQGITGQVAQIGQPIRVGSVRRIHNYLQIDQSTSSELCVPIKFKDRILGVINAESSRTNAFSTDDELLLGTLAGQLATAIEQLRAVTAERQWLEQLAHSNGLIYALANMTTHIEKALSAEEIFRTLGEELNKIDLICTIAIYTKDRSLFTVKYTSMEPKCLNKLRMASVFH